MPAIAPSRFVLRWLGPDGVPAKRMVVQGRLTIGRASSLLVGLACALALSLYGWRQGHPGPGAARGAAAVSAPRAAPGMRFGPATVHLAQPSDAPDVLTVRLRPGLRVRYLMDMPAMPGMGTSPFDALPAGRDTYSGMVIFPMAGRTRIVIQVLARGGWRPARVLLYEVDARRLARPCCALSGP